MKSLLIITLFAIIASIVNASEVLNTYESLGIDAIQKQEAEKKISEESLLPVINISTLNNTERILSREEYNECVIDIFNVEKEQELKERSARVKVRGNSSSFYGDVEQNKDGWVPYRIKFSKKTNIFGLHNGEEFKNWVLIKAQDRVINNDLAYKMARQIFGDLYVTDSKLVKLYINDKYVGIYVACEQNQVHEKRVNVGIPEKNYNGTDIGYYLELDNYFYTEEHWFPMEYEKATVKDIRGEERQFVQGEYVIKNDIYSQDQVDFITSFTQNVFKIVYLAIEKNEFKALDENNNIVNSTYTSAQETIDAVLDLESVVDMYLIYEIIHDYDVGEGSFFFAADFSKDSKNHKLQMVSPWDFDWVSLESPERYWAAAFCPSDFVQSINDRSNPWFIELGKEDWFHELASKKWETVSQLVRNQLTVEEKIVEDYLPDLILAAENVAQDAAGHIEWLDTRLSWMDRNFISGEKLILPAIDDEQPTENSQDIEEQPTEDIQDPEIELFEDEAESFEEI